MSLQDDIREGTREIREAIGNIEGKLKIQLRELEAANLRIRTRAGEIKTHRALLDSSRSTIQEVTEDITRLQRELKEKRDQLQVAQENLHAAETKASRAQRERRETEVSVEQLTESIDKGNREKDDLEELLNLKYAECFRQYVCDIQASLIQIASMLDATQASHDAFRALKKARHEDEAVSELCEAREDWQRLIRGAKVPLVLKRAQEEIHRIESELDSRFPGALEAETGNIQAFELLKELFFRETTGNKAWLFLPIDCDTWEAMKAGEDSVRTLIAAQTVWSMRKGLNLSWHDAILTVLPDHGLVALESLLEESLADQTFSVNIRDRGKVEFFFSRLPDTVDKALSGHHENP